MKFIHLADAHLDSPFHGLSFLPSKTFENIYQASDQSLKKIVDLAITEKVDLVLIAGDTFDSNHPSPHSQLFFAEQIKRLTEAKIQVVMIFGNHDHMQIEDLLVEPSEYFKLLGADEKVERATFTTKTGFNYDVVGFSYLHNHITEDKLNEFPKEKNNFTFGLMHAQEKTTTKSQNVYAPFSLSAMRNLNYDYFALGHIHLRQILSQKPLIAYSGNIQGRHINELGEKGCYLGEVNESSNGVELVFVPTSPIIWQKRTIELDSALSKNELSEKIKAINDLEQRSFLSIRLSGAEFLNDEEVDLVQDSDFWQNLSQYLPFNSQIVDLRLITGQRQLSLNNSDRLSFEKAAEEIFSTDEFRKIISIWAKKDKLATDISEDNSFKQEVENLTRIKLSRKLKGLLNDTETD